MATLINNNNLPNQNILDGPNSTASMYYLVYARKQAPTIVGIIEYHMLAPAKELYSDRD